MQSVLSTLSEENSSLPAPPQLSEVLFQSHGSPDYFSHFRAALRALVIGPKLDPTTETDQNLPLWLHAAQKCVA